MWSLEAAIEVVLVSWQRPRVLIVVTAGLSLVGNWAWRISSSVASVMAIGFAVGVSDSEICSTVSCKPNCEVISAIKVK